MSFTYDNGYYWTEVHIPRLVLLSEEAAYTIDYRRVVNNRSLDYNPEENLKIVIRKICGIYTDNDPINDLINASMFPNNGN